MTITIIDALHNLRPNAEWSIRGNGLFWADSIQTQPTEEEIQAKIQELQAAEPLRLLRIQRDRLLAEVDWWTSRVIDGIEMTQAQKDYRQALRDLPATAEPQLDENGNLTNITWPEKPE